MLIILILLLGMCVLMLFKNNNTYHVHSTIANAIYCYNIAKIMEHRYDEEIQYEEIESYTKTFFRLWDWDYKHLVSPKTLAKLQPYIGKEVHPYV